MKKKRIYYTAARRSFVTWLSAILALAAAAGYIANVTCGEGAGVCGAKIWLRTVLPVAGALYFAYQLLVNGKDRVYRTVLAFWALEIGFVYETCFLGLAWYWAAALIVVDLALLCLMHRVLSGTLGMEWLIIVIAGVYLAGIVWVKNELLHAPFCLKSWLSFLPDAAMLCAFIALCFAMQRVEDGKYHPQWGDRFDGRRVRSMPPISVVGNYIMPERNQANVMFGDKLEIGAMEKYIHAKRDSGYEKFGTTDVLLAAFVRTVAKYPGINRFLSGQKLFNRDEDIQFCMTVKKAMTTEAPDTVIKLHLTPRDTALDVYEKFRSAVGDVKKSEELDSGLDGLTAVFGMIPGVLLKFVIWLLKLLDYFGLLPRFLLEFSPFHGSVFFTSMASLGIPPVYHHLYNFGNLPIFLAFGKRYRVNELDDEGNMVSKKYMDYAFNVDERTVDGFYYATAIKYFHRLLLHPEQLDQAPEEVRRDRD